MVDDKIDNKMLGIILNKKEWGDKEKVKGAH